jgi:hypothetical protein
MRESVGLLLAAKAEQAVSMPTTDIPEKRLLAVITVALTDMRYSTPSAVEAPTREMAYEAAATCVLAAMVTDGWLIEPGSEAPKRARLCLYEGLQLFTLAPASREPITLARYWKTLAEALTLHLGQAGWVIEPPATLRKAPLRTPPH